jgi:50S ribosomal subunit-associated GTPase HflX
VRTQLQDLWAQVCEKAADLVDSVVKYGGGPPDVREALDTCASTCAAIETAEMTALLVINEIAKVERDVLTAPLPADLRERISSSAASRRERVSGLKKTVENNRHEMLELLASVARMIEDGGFE